MEACAGAQSWQQTAAHTAVDFLAGPPPTGSPHWSRGRMEGALPLRAEDVMTQSPIFPSLCAAGEEEVEKMGSKFKLGRMRGVGGRCF